MHPRNIYRDGLDFAQLGKDCPSFAKYLTKGPSNIDFHDPNAVRELTTSLLKRDFGVNVELPEDRLCPPVPNRLDYILWIQDLVDSTSGGDTDVYDYERDVVGLDIGVGASCIYPLLGCPLRPKWRFIGTDIDQTSLNHAARQLTLNTHPPSSSPSALPLSARITLHLTTPTAPFLHLPTSILPPLSSSPSLHETEKPLALTFTMCNPPFYPTLSSLLHSSSLKHLPPSTACTGSANEMVTPGGEAAFIRRMIDDSIPSMSNQNPNAQIGPHPDTETGQRVHAQWYTTLLGHRASLPPTLQHLREVGCTNIAVAVFVQGRPRGDGGDSQRTGTRRWGIAWSWDFWRPAGDVVAHGPGAGRLLGKFGGGSSGGAGGGNWKTEMEISISIESGIKQEGVQMLLLETKEKIDMILTSFLISSGAGITSGGDNDTNMVGWKWLPSTPVGKYILNGWVKGNIWSRSARRKIARGETFATSSRESEDGAMRFRIILTISDLHPDLPCKTDDDSASTTDEDFIPASSADYEVMALDTYGGGIVHTPPTQTSAVRRSDGEETRRILVTIRWLYGKDAILFESFCGMMRRKMVQEL